MTGVSSALLLVAILVAAAAFVLVTGNSLPPMVASHFVAGGAANGFMPRSDYLAGALVLAVGLPLFLGLLFGLARQLPDRFINLPNRDYWLAPARRNQTLRFLANQSVYFAALLSAFLCFVHWLVVRANGQRPPHFPESLFFTGLPLFLVALAIWSGAFLVRFGRRP